mmetsp:Transcript_13766/g.34596  ORF Transcript_13766/g.34596 Transcript_13766/m.34596 type:complete len:426 (+) Transcript_13766:141-1418(+)
MMKGISGTTSSVPRKRIRKNLNWTQNSKRWSVLAPLQMVLFWIVAKGKIRYILGVYTILLTISLHYTARTTSRMVSDFQTNSSLKASQEKSQFLPNVVYWSMPDAAKQALERELVQLQWSNKDSIFETKGFIQDAKDILSPYVTRDGDLLQTLNGLVAEAELGSTSIDAIVFENLPLDPFVPSTPIEESVRSLNKPTYIAEAMLMAMGELAGAYVVGYKAETEYSNPWAHEGFPRPGNGGSALTSTSGMLNHHQDMSYQRVIPDLLGLICLREGDDSSLRTTIGSVENIIQLLPKDVVSILRQERFKITASTQWVDAGSIGDHTVRTRALLEGTSLHLPVRWDNMVGIDREASQAIESLRNILQIAKPSGVHLREGEMIIFNNQKVIHGRTPYQNLKFDGQSDRVVIRSYFVKQLNADQIESRII